MPVAQNNDKPGKDSVMCIRPMILDDVPAVAELEKICFANPWPYDSFRYEVQSNPFSFSYCAEKQGRIIAYAITWEMVDELHIANIAVHPDFRGQHIATTLLKHILAQGIGCTKNLILVVSVSAKIIIRRTEKMHCSCHATCVTLIRHCLETGRNNKRTIK